MALMESLSTEPLAPATALLGGPRGNTRPLDPPGETGAMPAALRVGWTIRYPGRILNRRNHRLHFSPDRPSSRCRA
jgi:hypothetical protein